MFIRQKQHSGFSMAEALVSFMLIGLALAATIPLMTQMSQLRTGTDKNTLQCITGNSFADDWTNTEPDPDHPQKWYDNNTGVTSIPTTAPDPVTEALKNKCYAAITDAQYGRGKAVETATWYAAHGTDTQKTIAKKILRATCDKGGKQACDYFINTCWHDGDTENPSTDDNKMYCDDINSYFDLTYYLHQNRGTNTNPGAGYISAQLDGLLPKMITNLVNEVSYARNNNQLPTGETYDPPQNLNDNIASELAVAQIYIRGCNLGFNAACNVAWDPDDDGNPSDSYNTSCTAVKTAWSEAPTGNYRLTYPGDPAMHAPVEVYCNMSSTAAAAVAGCNADPPVAGDCKAARDNNYNRTCNQLYTTFQSAFGCGNYTLTGGYGPPDYDYTDLETGQYCCNLTGNQCIIDGVGSECDDGTIYAGEYNNYYYFTSKEDELNISQTGYATNYGGAGCLLNSNNSTYGMMNQEVLLAAQNQNCNLYDDYDAIKACGEWLNADAARNLGHTDWYLPATNELNLLYTNKDVGILTGTFPIDAYYWTSTELEPAYSTVMDFSTGGILTNTTYDPAWGTIRKELMRNVRCIRKENALNAGCPNSGDRCPDQTIYAGMYGGKYIFTMLHNEAVKYKWGIFQYDVPGAFNVNDGYQNFVDVVNGKSKIITDINAARVCQRKNDNMDNTHDDWYLPAVGELSSICSHKDKIGNFQDQLYVSSTETSKTGNSAWEFANCSSYGDGKNSSRRIRCVRREAK